MISELFDEVSAGVVVEPAVGVGVAPGGGGEASGFVGGHTGWRDTSLAAAVEAPEDSVLAGEEEFGVDAGAGEGGLEVGRGLLVDLDGEAVAGQFVPVAGPGSCLLPGDVAPGLDYGGKKLGEFAGVGTA